MAPRRLASKSHSQPRHSGTAPGVESSGSKTSLAAPTDIDVAPNKRDRRQYKRSSLLSRAALSSDRKTSGISKSSARRKGRSEKLKTKKHLAVDLGSLIDVLETHEGDDGSSTTPAESSSNKATQARALVSNTRSIKSKSGMQKRKAAISLLERQRMGRNLAIMGEGRPKEQGEQNTSTADAARAEKWSAIRRHIVTSNVSA